MEYFVFKLNLEPSVLDAYNYNSHKEHVVGRVIPESLKRIFSEFLDINENKVKFVDYIDLNEVKTSIQYEEMLKLNETMVKMYTEVVANYNIGKGINYTPEYLEHRDKLNKSIENIIFKFPFLKGAFELKDNIFPIEAFSKIKMAVTYISRARKIESYINSFPVNILNSEFIYDRSYELIYISAINKTTKEAENYIEVLEEKINNFSSVSNIGRISINPVYEEFSFEGMYSEITIEIVYPNGHPARDRSKAIKEANAAREKRTFEASKEEKINAFKLNEYFKEDAEKGYIKSATSRGKSIIKSVIKKVSFQEE